MADYRLDCPTKGCTYTGFNGHSPHCPIPREYLKRSQAEHEEKMREKEAWDEFFDGFDDEDIFRYIETCDNEVKRVERFRRRSEMAKRYLREKGRITKYLDWTRR